MPFIVFLKSFEAFLYEVMAWIVFYPRTLWRAVRHPLRLMDRTAEELKLSPEQQFKDVLSPPIFLLITVVAANGFEVAMVGKNQLIDDGIGLAGMITDNTSLILFRLVAFASLPVMAAAFALTISGRELDRVSLQPVFYAQCFATTPVVLLCSIAATLSRLPQRLEDLTAFALLIVAALYFIGVESSWFKREMGRGWAVGVACAIAVFVMSMLVLLIAILAFSGN